MDIKKLIEEIVRDLLSEEKTLVLSEKNDRIINKYGDFISGFEDMDFYEESTNIDPYERILVPEINLNDFIDIAQGKSNSHQAKIIIDGILRGKEVVIIEEGMDYIKYKDICQPGFLEYLQGLEVQLKNFGIKLMDLKEINSCIGKDKLKPPSGKLYNKKIITKADIDELGLRGEKTLNIRRDSLITDLGLEAIKDKGILVYREGDSL